MSDETRESVVHRTLDDESVSPATEVVEIVADLEGKPQEELATIWSCIDDLLDHVFSNPPDPEAQVEVNFSYEGYRITVDQGGTVTFVET